MRRPDFTAFIVALAIGADRRVPAWRGLVTEQAEAVARACAGEACRGSLLYRFLYALPERVKILLMDWMVAYGFALHVALRKSAIEVQARVEIQKGAEQVVIIGAGFDSLAMRLAQEFPQLRCYELDLPATQEIKRRALVRAGIALPENLHLIACDLSHITLEQVLKAQAGFKTGARSYYVAEGLSMYLTEADNRSWLRSVQVLSGEQGCVAFTALEALSSVDKMGAVARDRLLKHHDTGITWSIHPDAMGAFLHQAGCMLTFMRSYQDMQRTHRSGAEMQRVAAVQGGEHVYFVRTVIAA